MCNDKIWDTFFNHDKFCPREKDKKRLIKYSIYKTFSPSNKYDRNKTQ